MTIKPDETMIFDDIFELNYEILMNMEMEILPDGSIHDPEKNVILSMNNNIIKVSIKPNEIHYPGQNEISFDILENIRLTTLIFGLYLQKKIDNSMPFISYYQEERENNDIKYTSLIVKQTSENFATTNYYHNKCLKFIEMIFLLEDQKVDLSNFDVIE